MDQIAEQVGRQIRLARQAKGFTQEELGKHIALTRTSVNNIERGRQQILVRTLLQIAKVLDVKPDDLLAIDGDEHLPSDVNRFINNLSTKA